MFVEDPDTPEKSGIFWFDLCGLPGFYPRLSKSPRGATGGEGCCCALCSIALNQSRLASSRCKLNLSAVNYRRQRDAPAGMEMKKWYLQYG